MNDQANGRTFGSEEIVGDGDQGIRPWPRERPARWTAGNPVRNRRIRERQILPLWWRAEYC